jgi:2'-5' RNA ligase
MRCFIAIHLPSSIQLQISDYIRDLKKISSDVRWIKVENIHLTLKFLGEIDPTRVELIKQTLSPLSTEFSQFSINISGTGCFPNKKRPRVFWLGVEQGKENPLFNLHSWLDNKIAALGFEKENRRFSPHLTLGRVKGKDLVDFSDLFNYIEQVPFSPIDFQVEEILFMRSFLKPTGAEYQVIESYPLK